MKHPFRYFLLFSALFASVSAQEIKFSGQLRERSEFDTKSFNKIHNITQNLVMLCKCVTQF